MTMTHQDALQPPASFDLIIVGAGPIGLQCAILAQRAGLRYVVLDKGPVVAAIARYPTYMTFFTTSERLEIGGHPLIAATDKPTRKEALDYYRKVVANEGLDVRTCSKVTAIERTEDARGDDRFTVHVNATAPSGYSGRMVAPVVIVATGYFDNPNLLGIPGEDAGSVSHYYSEGHHYYGRPVVVIGGGSSAADAALDLYRAGAKVTMVHRGADFKKSRKYWIRPNLENRIREGSINAIFNATVTAVHDGTVEVHVNDATDEVTARGSGSDGRALTVQADHVYALTGYHAPTDLVLSAGATVDPITQAVHLDTETRESNVRGLYVVGSAGSGRLTSEVFIENGLVHVERAMKAVRQRISEAHAATTATLR